MNNNHIFLVVPRIDSSGPVRGAFALQDVKKNIRVCVLRDLFSECRLVNGRKFLVGFSIQSDIFCFFLSLFGLGTFVSYVRGDLWENYTASKGFLKGVFYFYLHAFFILFAYKVIFLTEQNKVRSQNGAQ